MKIIFAKKNIVCYNKCIKKKRGRYMAKEINKEKVLEAYKQAIKNGTLTEGQLFAFSQFLSQFTDEFGYMIEKVMREFCPDVAIDIYKLHHFKIMDDILYLNYDAGELGERESSFYMPLSWIGSNLTKKEKKIEGEIVALENRQRYLKKTLERKSETLKYLEEEYKEVEAKKREVK